MGKKRETDIAFNAGVVVYVASALVFLSELIGEISGYYLFTASWLVHEIIAIVTFLGFFVGGLLIWHSYRLIQRNYREMQQVLRSAQGEFFEMLNLQFDRWELSEAERDVALLTVKGMSVNEIAELRNTSVGTIKSQNNSIYRKADVKSRTQLLGKLIDQLLVDTALLTS
ncbi:helix-turn-helix transcriptional regulator [Tateyamaria pelophila]|uniref:helix-turn-helix transcriptional regulator n=1 Tax=Tateyamaria pelophila TaxID=328415 RepID=UPI001CBB4405|nr:LuxR C-terminal-related transcriptional regulator [Tateyamaria pelophila]